MANSDGGAHVGMICDGSFPTSLLTHWTRGPKLSLPFLIQRQCAATAALVGLHDRGRIAIGYRADPNVIGHARPTLHAPEIAHDLPAGGRGLMQRASSCVATICAGALPGRLVRGAQAAPMA